MDTPAPEPEAPLVAPDHDVRRRLALVLDLDDLVAARRLAQTLRPWFGVAKVGLELYSAAGPEAIESMVELGYEVFVDLKLHDIPTTVGKASTVLGSLGASYVTMHAHGGVPMLQAGVEGLLAHAHLSAAVPRLAISVAALSVSLAMMVAIAIMIGSFRETVVYWVSQTLQADLFISPGGRGRPDVVGTISPEVVGIVTSSPDVAGTGTTGADPCARTGSYPTVAPPRRGSHEQVAVRGRRVEAGRYVG